MLLSHLKRILLVCLVAVFAAGWQSGYASWVMEGQQEMEESAPADDSSQDEEEISIVETPLRGRSLILFSPVGLCARLAPVTSVWRLCSFSLGRPLAAELAARNGCGGPLRL